MPLITLNINGKSMNVDVDSTSTPLLWVLRDMVRHPDTGQPLTGTKYGCGIVYCSACVVLVDGNLSKTCQSPVSGFTSKRIVTIEGLGDLPAAGTSGVTGKMLQDAWVDVQVPQCGWCQSGILLATYALLRRVAKPSDADINSSISNICACGTYPRVRRAIKLVTGQPV
jgi:isoquinoline 1-oxidoreductase alpha subunit